MLTIVVALLMSFQSSAQAASGLTLADFKLQGAVADVGTTVSISLHGTMDRDLHVATGGLRKSPVFTVQQSCQSDSNPSLVQVASGTINFPFASFSSTTAFVDPGHGKKVEWNVTLFYDPAADPILGRPNPPGPNTMCPLGFSPTSPITVTHVLMRVWPGVIGSPLQTTKGERLWVVLDFDTGQTVVGARR